MHDFWRLYVDHIDIRNFLTFDLKYRKINNVLVGEGWRCRNSTQGCACVYKYTEIKAAKGRFKRHYVFCLFS